MKLALVLGKAQGNSIKQRLQGIKDNLDIDCFDNIADFINSAIMRNSIYDRILVLSTLVNPQTANDLYQYWGSRSKDTNIVMLGKSGKDNDVAKGFLEMFKTPLVTSMLVDNTTVSIIAEAVLEPIPNITKKYGIPDYLQVEVETSSYVQDKPKEVKPVQPVQNNTGNKEKRSLFGALFGSKKKKGVENQPNGQVGNQPNGQVGNQPNGQVGNQPNGQGMSNGVVQSNNQYNGAVMNNQMNTGYDMSNMQNQYGQYQGSPNAQQCMPNVPDMQNQSGQYQGIPNVPDMQNQSGQYQGMSNGVVNSKVASGDTFDSPHILSFTKPEINDDSQSFNNDVEIPVVSDEFTSTMNENSNSFNNDGTNGLVSSNTQISCNIMPNIGSPISGINVMQEENSNMGWNDVPVIDDSESYDGFVPVNNQTSDFGSCVDTVDEDFGSDVDSYNGELKSVVASVDEDFSNDDIGSMEEKYREATQQPKVVTQTVVKEVIRNVGGGKTALTGVYNGKLKKVLIVTGDRATGITSTAMNIAKTMSKKVPILYFDCDCDNHGLLSYIDYANFKNYENTHMQGVKLCHTSNAFSKCVIKFDDNLDILSSDYSCDCTDEELQETQEIVAERVGDYGVVVVDCPVSKLHLIPDLLLIGQTVVCVEGSKRGFMNMLCCLESSPVSTRHKRTITSRGTMFVTKCAKDLDLKHLVNYIKGIYEPDSVDWLSMSIVPFNGKLDDKLLNDILEG